MTENPITKSIDELTQETETLLNIILQKRTGNTFAYPGGIDIPEINLNQNEIIKISDELQKNSEKVKNIAKLVSKRFGSELDALITNLVDKHALALQTILAIQQREIHFDETGMILNPILDFKNALLQLRRNIITLHSYDPEGKRYKKAKSVKSTKSLLSKKQVISIVVTIFVALTGIGGTAYYFTVNVNQQNVGDNSNSGNEQTGGVNVNVGGSGNTVTVNPTKTETNPILQKPQLSLDLLLHDQPNNATFATLILYNNGSASASGIIVTINPTNKILNYDRDYWVDELNFISGGDLSLKIKMPRMASCSTMAITLNTAGMLKDTDYSVYVTSDNGNSLIYQTSVDGKKFLDPNTFLLDKNPCN